MNNPSKDAQKPCRCRKLFMWASTSKESQYRCRCGQTVHTVKLTKEQQKARKDNLFRTKMHDLYHGFSKHRNHKNAPDKGYELMSHLEKFVGKHPEIVTCGVDDSSHCGSDIH